MTDPENLPEVQTKEKGALWNHQIADMVIKAIGGAGWRRLFHAAREDKKREAVRLKL